MSTDAKVSIVIRAKDEEASIGQALDLLAAQSDPPDEVVVVDSGSRDGTARIAQTAGATLVQIPADSFSFGGALNVGCENASGELIVALSAHAFPRDPEWLTNLVKPFADERVACVCGQRHAPSGEPLTGPLSQDASLARCQFTIGYSNAAGAFRAELWRQRGFREDMPATEDKEWALYWLDRGYLSILDPHLDVDHDHSKDSLRDQYRRARREWQGYAIMLGGLPPHSIRDLISEWWTDQRTYRSLARARLSHRRAARLLGAYVGRQRGPG